MSEFLTDLSPFYIYFKGTGMPNPVQGVQSFAYGGMCQSWR